MSDSPDGTPVPHGHSLPPGHVLLLAGIARSNKRSYELLPAESLGGTTWRLWGTPYLAQGCAAGDTLEVEVDGSFRVSERGGNLGIVSYADDGPLTEEDASLLNEGMTPLGGLVERHPQGIFLLVTVPLSATFGAVEEVLASWKQTTGQDWMYVNVHADDGSLLNWW